MRSIDIIQAALEELGSYSPGDTLTDADAERGLKELNKMLSVWSNQNLLCFALYTQSFPMVVNQAAYTIGVGGNINAARPLNIVDIYLRDAQSNNYPIEIYTQEQWNRIQNRQVTSQYPTVMFYDSQYPLGIINLWPIPSSTFTVFINSPLKLTAFTDLTTVVSLPDGYEDVLQHNLCVRLAPFFNLQPSPVTVALAAEGKGILKVKNNKPVPSVCDAALVFPRGNSYNIFTDSFGRGGA